MVGFLGCIQEESSSSVRNNMLNMVDTCSKTPLTPTGLLHDMLTWSYCRTLRGASVPEATRCGGKGTHSQYSESDSS